MPGHFYPTGEADLTYDVAKREANKEEAMKRMQEEINFQRETILELKAVLKAIAKLAQ